MPSKTLTGMTTDVHPRQNCIAPYCRPAARVTLAGCGVLMHPDTSTRARRGAAPDAVGAGASGGWSERDGATGRGGGVGADG